MLLCIGNLDPKVNEVVTVKTSCVVVESAGVSQVTLTFPLRPPLKTFFFSFDMCIFRFIFHCGLSNETIRIA